MSGGPAHGLRAATAFGHTGQDPFGPPVRREVVFAAKLREYKKLGFDGVQLHDNDAVEPDLDPQQTERAAARVKKLLDGEGNARRLTYAGPAAIFSF
jgi:hypothetical protein